MIDDPMPPNDEARHAVVAGGGSGGHVYPGLAVAAELSERGWTVSWLGRPRGMERRLVEQAGVPYLALAAAPLVGQGVVGKVKALLTLLTSALAGRRLVRRAEAAVVVGTGGYVSAPAVLGARLARTPTLLIEPNAAAGAANRFLSRWSTAAALAYPAAAGEFDCPTEVTGVPVRSAFFRQPPLAADAHRLLVVGGSQGAAQLNGLLPPVFARLAERLPSLTVVHQAGDAHVDAVRLAYADLGVDGGRVEVIGFVDDMPAALGGATLVVSRAGANMLAELCATGRPSVLVPLAQAGGHQADNARRLADAGAALCATGSQLEVDELVALLGDLLNDRPRLERMATAARELARPHAARSIADLAERLADGGGVEVAA